MLTQMTRNEASGNFQIVVDEADLGLLRKALWDEQLFLAGIMRGHPDHRGRLWHELSERVLPLARAIGARIAFETLDQIIRKGIETK